MHNYFVAELSSGAKSFEIFLAIFLALIFIFGIKNYKFFALKFFALIFGVFAFEILTSSLWLIEHLGKYSYINGDVSIIMTLFWSSIIMFSKIVFDKINERNNKNRLFKEYIFVIIISSIIGLLTLIYLKSIGIFSYGEEMQKIISSGILIFGKPLESIIYFPIFVFTSFSFYKYWEMIIENKIDYNTYSINLLKDVFIGVLILLAIGYLIHPLLITKEIENYFYLGALCLLALTITNFIISIIKGLPIFIRFFAGTAIFTILVSLILSYFIGNNLIILSESLKNTYTDKTIFLHGLHITDVEFSGIVFFSYLVIAVIKYIKIVTDNKLIGNK